MRVYTKILLFGAALFFSASCFAALDPETKEYYFNGGTDLEFQIKRGENEESFFLRRGKNQSQTVLESGKHAQIETAFLAGNSSASLFPAIVPNLKFKMIDKPSAFSAQEGEGVRYVVEANQNSLQIEAAVVGSTRAYRRYEHQKISNAKTKPELIAQNRILFSRERLDHKGRYSLQVTIPEGSADIVDGQAVFKSAHPVRLLIEALTSDHAYEPLPAPKIFSAGKLKEISIPNLQAAMFLMNAEKIVAGGHRYLTYFGRDILLTFIYNAEILEPDVMEVALSAAFEREAGPKTVGAEDGDIAHEEAIGDTATRKNMQAGLGPINTPVLDYKMIDTVFLLAPFFDLYLKKAGVTRAATFLKRKTSEGRTYRDALAANLKLVLKRTEAFVHNPTYQNLVSFRPAFAVGDWRDSLNGHGSMTEQEADALHKNPADEGGRYSFGVNVALVPSALKLTSQFFERKQLGLFDRGRAAEAKKAYAVWRDKARSLFQLTASAAEATKGARSYATFFNLKTPAPLKEPISYSALSLDINGKPIKALHSDEGFDLLLNELSDDVLDEAMANLLRPFPYGLIVPHVGMVVANPILTNDAKMFSRFSPKEYHGGVWASQIALMERGLARQLKFPHKYGTRRRLREAHRLIEDILHEQAAHKSEEVWSWKSAKGEPAYVPYEEGNALQLWNLSLLIDEPSISMPN
jgi:hypothetical protein